MNRRAFSAGFFSTLTWSFAARPQQRPPVIGYLGPSPFDTDALNFDAFREGLRDLGYVEGRNVEIKSLWPERGTERLPELADELVSLKVDIMVSGAQGVYVACKATKAIPIVASAAGDLVALGLAESLAHPGGNVTGQTIFAPQLIVKRVEMLRRVKPSMTRLGLLLPRGVLSAPTYVRALQEPTQSMGLALQVIEVSDLTEYADALSAGPAAKIDGLVLTDFPLFSDGTTIAALAASCGVASAGYSSFARNGGLLAYSVDFPSMYRSAVRFVDKILKGAKPGDIPIEQATKFETIVNLKTARALGLEFPPTLLAAADEVIE